MKPTLACVTLGVIALMLTCQSGVRADATAPPPTPSGPPTQPMLRIETGMDTAGIRRVATDADQHILVTASLDKTLRIWDASNGAPLGVLRPPIGDGNDGKLYCVAVSPDGETIATGGWTGYDWDNTNSIYLFDRETGRMIKRLAGLPDVVDEVEFSPDGKYLVAGIGDTHGLRLYNTNDWSLVGEDDAYKAETYGQAFWEGDGHLKLATTSYDGNIRLYKIDPSGQNRLSAPLVMPTRGGASPFGIQFSPDGTKLAIGFSDQAAVTVLSGTDLSYLFTRSVVGTGDGNTTCPVWSADGTTLYAAGSYGTPQTSSIFRWREGGKGPQAEITALQNSINTMTARGNDGVFVGTGFPAVGAIDQGGNTVFLNSANVADYPVGAKYFKVNNDGSQIQFSYDQDLKFTGYLSVASSTVGLDSGDSHAGLNDPILSADGIDVEHYREVTDPTLNGKPLDLEDRETARSLAIAPDKSCFILGTEWYIRCFKPDGSHVWDTKVPETAWAVNISGNGNVVVAALGDGTIRWYRMSDGAQLLACFPLGDKKRWVMWTPSGYYDCSVGGEDLLGWHVNRGKDEAADFFPASRFRDEFYRPDVVAKVLGDLDEDKAVHDADEASNRTYEKPDVLGQLPPIVKILRPDGGAPNPGGSVTVKYLVRAGSTEKAEAVHFQVDGRNVGRAIRVQLVSTNEQEATETLDVPSSSCTVSVIAENRFGSSQAASVLLRWKGDVLPPSNVASLPKLYILAIGVSKYQNAAYALRDPASDAQAFVAAMRKQKGVVYSDVIVQTITDLSATRAGIEDGLQWIQQTPTGKDVAMVFLDGHGTLDNLGKFIFVPCDFDPDHAKSTGVTSSDITDTLAAIPGKAILFLDTPHSGIAKTDTTGIVNELASAENGTVVFTASTGNETTVEGQDADNDAFTTALVEGLHGTTAAAEAGKVTVDSLYQYVSARVPQITGGKQHPQMERPSTVLDFQVASAAR